MTTESPRSRYRIVIGVDFQKTGDDAIADALRLAREHTNAELHAVNVVRSAGPSPTADDLAKMSREMEDALAAMKERVHDVCERAFPGEEWDQHMVFHVRVGEPANALHQVAIDYDASLLVVGTHARRGLEKMVLGSVAEELMKMAHLPVLVARERTLGGLPRSERPEPPREGVDIHDDVHRSELVRFGRRGSHIAGLI
jgi:nucleotide-binding universal stress UspA family protein